jgi:hypothetical protein
MPNTIKATNLTVTKSFPKFFIAQDTFKKADGTEGKQNYKVWSTIPVQTGQVVNIIGSASANVNEFVEQATGKPIVYAQLSINAKEVEIVSQAATTSWDTF